MEKTKAEAQALVDVEVEASQAAWDALSEADRGTRTRPGPITIP